MERNEMREYKMKAEAIQKRNLKALKVVMVTVLLIVALLFVMLKLGSSNASGSMDLDKSDIIRHYDVTGKICPKYYVENEGAWKKFSDSL